MFDPEIVNAFQDLPLHPAVRDWEPEPTPADWRPDNDTPSIWEYPYA